MYLISLRTIDKMEDKHSTIFLNFNDLHCWTEIISSNLVINRLETFYKGSFIQISFLF